MKRRRKHRVVKRSDPRPAGDPAGKSAEEPLPPPLPRFEEFTPTVRGYFRPPYGGLAGPCPRGCSSPNERGGDSSSDPCRVTHGSFAESPVRGFTCRVGDFLDALSSAA